MRLAPGEGAIPAFDVPVRQTIGSGDVFAGTMCGALATRRELEEACAHAAAAAATWIASDDPLPGPDFAEAVERRSNGPRLPVVAPDALRTREVVVSHAKSLGAEALAEKTRRALLRLGMRVAPARPAARADVRVELAWRELRLTVADPAPLAGLDRLAGFVAETLG